MKQSQETFLPPPSFPSPHRNEFSPVPWWQQCWPVLFWREAGPSDVLCFFCCLPPTVLHYQGRFLHILFCSQSSSWASGEVHEEKNLLMVTNYLWVCGSQYLYMLMVTYPTFSKSLNILIEFPFQTCLEPDIPSSGERQLCSLEEFIFSKSSGWLVALRPQLSAYLRKS